MHIPKEVQNLLRNKKLCMMATCWQDKPYLSLMNFTYIEEENKVILSSRKDSKKYFNIQKNKFISLLVFSSSNQLSVTLLGTVVTMDEENEKHYKEQHLKKNNMPQFILGDHIGLIIFEIDKMIVSNSKDEIECIDNFES